MQTIIIPATSANMGPGFDCLGIALCCYNTISFEFMEKGLKIELPKQDRGKIPTDERNLIYRVFDNTLKKLGVVTPGLHIIQTNDIPAVRGLGSSAACVVGGVLLADCFTGGKLTAQEKAMLCSAEDGHPDNVLPALFGGITIGGMEDGELRFIRLEPPSAMRLTVFVPPFMLSTKKARAALPQMVPLQDAVFNASHTALLIGALAMGDLSLLPFAMRDRLHQPYRIPLIPGYMDIERIARENGALVSYLSGAGPAIVGVWDGAVYNRRAIAEEVESIGWKAMEIDVDIQGCRIEETMEQSVHS